MPFVVVTGGPGVGKTTLLAELARRGHRIGKDVAREIIAERKRKKLTPRPAQLEFAKEVLRRDLEQCIALKVQDGLVFLDRSPIDSVGLRHEASPLPKRDLGVLLDAFEFVSPVFILPPWPEIFANDAERDQSFNDAVQAHVRTAAWYSGLGYKLNEVPPGTVEQRADYVLGVLGLGDA